MPQHLQKASKNMILLGNGKKEREKRVEVGVSAECISGDAGGQVVIADHPRHDAAGIEDV